MRKCIKNVYFCMFPKKSFVPHNLVKKMSSVALFIADIAKTALYDTSGQQGQNRERSYLGLWDGM